MKRFYVVLFFLICLSTLANAQTSVSSIDAKIAEISDEKSNLEQKKVELSIRYTSDYSEIREINKKITELEKKLVDLEKEKIAIINPKGAKLLDEILALRVQVSNCKSCFSDKINFVKKLKQALVYPSVLEIVLAESSSNELLLIIALQNQKLLESKK